MNGLLTFQVKESKGKKRQRSIVLTERMLDVVRDLCQRWPKGPIFRHGKGGAWTRHSIKNRFLRLAERTAIRDADGKVVGPGIEACAYDYRHIYATRALERGVDPVTLSILMGHADVSMISRHYAHLQQRIVHLRAAAERAAGA